MAKSSSWAEPLLGQTTVETGAGRPDSPRPTGRPPWVPWSGAGLAERIEAALGLRPCDLLLHDGRIVNVFTREVMTGSVGIWRDRIVAVGELPAQATGPETRIIDVGGRYVLPGFVEPHFHVADTGLSPSVLARALLELGTTSLATDMVELYCMGGVEAVRWAIDEAQSAGLRILFMLPLHALGAEETGTFRRTPRVEDFREMATWPETIGINEPPPGVVLDRNPGVLEIIELLIAERKVFEGHAPGLGGIGLQAYVAAGSSSDHEAVSYEEALERLRLGHRIIMRECEASPDLDALVPLLVQDPLTARFFMLGTDDMAARELVVSGHVDHKLRKLIHAGVDPVVAIQIATLNPAEYFGLADHLGSVTPGKIADLLLVDDLAEMRPTLVIAGGMALSNREAPGGNGTSIPADLISEVRLGRTVDVTTFRIPAPVDEGSALVRVMGIVDHSIRPDARQATCQVRDGAVLADPVGDVLKIAVMDRHHGSGAIGRGFVQGFGLRRGAIAATAVWQHFSLLVVGTTDEEMVSAVSALQSLGGGFVAVAGGETLATVPLPIAGVLSDAPLAVLVDAMQEFESATRDLGCPLSSPVMSLMFASITHIPECGITDLGWYDTAGERFVDVVLATEPSDTP